MVSEKDTNDRYKEHTSTIVTGTIYDCPAIHFITGMTEKADDPDKLIIAYGVEDCTSWFIEVGKEEVVKLLFEPPRVAH